MTRRDPPGAGYMLSWVEGGYPREEFFSGQGFSLRAKERAATLLVHGHAPKCYAVVPVWQVVEDGKEAKTMMLHDDWMPVLNHILVKQQDGGLMQEKPRGRPQKTLAEIKEELNAARSGQGV